MIVSLRSLSYEDLKAQLSTDDKIVIMSCNTCIVACGIGGLTNMTTLEGMLKADGYNVIGKDLVSIGCNVTLIKKHKEDITKKDMYNEATVIIPLICENGLEGIRYVFEDKKVISVTKTLGTGNFTADRGVVLTSPLENVPLEKNVEGYELDEVAEKIGLFEDFFDEYEAADHEPEYVTLTVNGEEIESEKGQNLLQACESNGIEIPHLCYNEELSEAGVCRLCLVKVKGMRGLVPSCCTKVKEGMEVITEDEELISYKRVILELILASNEHNCLTCDKGVPNPMYSCNLQAMMRKYGVDGTRYERNTEPKPVDTTSPVFNYDPNRCILCGQCVRACEEIAGQCNLGFINRGSKTRVAAGLNINMDKSNCVTCMACVNVCPTGALSEKYVKFEGKDFEPKKVFCNFSE